MTADFTRNIRKLISMDVTVEDCETTYEQVVSTTTTAKNNVCTS